MADCFRRAVALALVREPSALSSSVKKSFSSVSSSSDALIEVKPGEVGMISGIPEEHLRRRVIIYSPARSASQTFCPHKNTTDTFRWENPLMGWTSTGDPYANVGEAGLCFNSEEAAKAFAEKHGWEYAVKKCHTPLLKPKSYADNFKWKGPPEKKN